MTFVLLLTLLVGSFFILGKAADVLVVHVRRIGERLGVNTFFLGVLIGLFTSFPELALGINAYVANAQVLSLGNLFGGIPVLLGFVLGLSVVLNRKTNTKGVKDGLIFTLAYLILPLLLGLDGRIGMVDGLLLVSGYFLLVRAHYARHKHMHGTEVRHASRNHVLHHLFLIVLSIVAVLLMTNVIVRVTRQLSDMLHVPDFLVGLLVLSIGTNLPEIATAFRSWKHRDAELGLSIVLGSAMVNPLLIGVFSFLRAYPITLGPQYLFLIASFVVILTCTFLFVRSDARLVRREGWLLLGLYAVYVFAQAALGG
jgi:cation:H+ antiporter